MPESHFDESTAQRYADLWPELFDPAVIDPAVRFLAEAAAGGPALEFGIGTGRIAISRDCQLLSCWIRSLNSVVAMAALCGCPRSHASANFFACS